MDISANNSHKFKLFKKAILRPDLELLKTILALTNFATTLEWLSYRNSENDNILHYAARCGAKYKLILGVLSRHYKGAFKTLYEEESNNYHMTPRDVVSYINETYLKEQQELSNGAIGDYNYEMDLVKLTFENYEYVAS